METTNKLDLKSTDFEQQCLRNILARATLLATISEDAKELRDYTSIAMALASCSKSLERNIPMYISIDDLDDECDGNCDNCELNCEDYDDPDDEF